MARGEVYHARVRAKNQKTDEISGFWHIDGSKFYPPAACLHAGVFSATVCHKTGGFFA
jgi:hypothetical protein